MASLKVAAIVVSHGRADLLVKSLDSIAAQSHPIQQVAVVETAADESCIQLAKSFGFAVLSPGDVRLGTAIQAGIDALSQVPGWLWIMHDDLVADPHALTNLARAAEISPSVAVIGPKLLEAGDSIQIQQMGLTATKTGRPFLLVEKEYDQGQHDKAGDTLSVSTAGMLISHGVWQQLGGLDDATPPLAQDLEFGAKARLSGYRVIVEASAKMHHEALALKGARPKQWLGGTPKRALSKAHLHMATLILPLPIVILLYLALPAIVLLSIPIHLVSKQPGRIFSQIFAWLWAWLHIGQLLSARRKFRSLGSVQILNGLLASRKQIRTRRRSRFQFEPEPTSGDQPLGIFRSNSAWFALLPISVAMGIWPQGAITANGLLPLGSSFSSVLASTANNTQQYLQGISAPSDPFTWFLAAIAAIWPSDPSLGFATAVFAAPTVAFFGVWFLAKQLLTKAWVVTLLALAYSLSPQLLSLTTSLSVVELFAASFLPWAAGFALRAFDAYNAARAWRWVGITGLALALVAVLSATLFAMLAILVVVLGLSRPRRFFLLLWSLVPGVALLYPWATFALQTKNLELLTVTSSFAASPQPLEPIDIAIVVVLSILAIASWFKLDSAKIAWFWIVAIAGLVVNLYQPLASARPMVLASVLSLLLTGGAWVESLKNKGIQVTAAAIAGGLVVTSIGVYGPWKQVDPVWAEARVMPALVVAASEMDPGTRTVVIDVSEKISVEYVWNSGQTMERVSLLQAFIPRNEDVASQVANAAGNLIAGNGEGFDTVADALRIDFVLVRGSNPEVLTVVSAVDSLQPAGESEFGALFRVEGSVVDSVEIDEGFRNLQLWVLAMFGLLAIPTRASIRGYRRVKTGIVQ